MPDHKLKNVVIYTDGACSGNPGNGGWGAILSWNGHKHEIYGDMRNTTNNKKAIMVMKITKEQMRWLVREFFRI